MRQIQDWLILKHYYEGKNPAEVIHFLFSLQTALLSDLPNKALDERRLSKSPITQRSAEHALQQKGLGGHKKNG